jgi:hypothetical protein
MADKVEHVIHTAIRWKASIENGEVRSLSEIAMREGLSRARVTQIMNLLKLSPEMSTFLLGLDDPEEIRKYSERRLRGSQSLRSAEARPVIGRKRKRKSPSRKPRKTKPKKAKEPPKVKVVEVGPLPPENLEALKILIGRVALRKIRELENEARKGNTARCAVG